MSKTLVATANPVQTEHWRIALSDAALRRASSAKIFERGQTYAASGKVEITAQTKAPRFSVNATVLGTDTYSVEVWLDEDNSVDGECDCLSAEDGWFCKHQVAVALVWRDRLSGVETAVDSVAQKKVEASSKRAKTVKDQQQALHDFLHGLDSATLASKLLEFADQYRELARALQQWRKLATVAVNAEPADLKRLLSEILAPGDRFIDWRESYDYARRAGAVIPLLQQAIKRDPASAVVLGTHALRRMWSALLSADDSNGDISGVCEQIGDAWVAALVAASPQAASFGDTYLQLRLDDPFGSYDTDAAENAMGAPALARYRSALTKRWQDTQATVLAQKAKLGAGGKPARDPGMYRSRSESEYALSTLESLHRAQLEKMGDTEAVLALLRADMSQPYAHSRVIAFLEKHRRFREAAQQAELAYKTFPDNTGVQDDVLRCYERDGCTTEALALRRRQFDESPDVGRFQNVLQATAGAGEDVEAMRTALWLQIEADELAPHERRGQGRPLSWQEVHAPTGVRNVSLRAAILCTEKKWREAALLVQPPVICELGLLQRIAEHLPASEAEQTVAMLQRVFAAKMPGASTPYFDVLALAADIAKRMEPLRRKSWLAGLRSVYKAKRNFIKGLPAD